jgi:hypothetical protein
MIVIVHDSNVLSPGSLITLPLKGTSTVPIVLAGMPAERQRNVKSASVPFTADTSSKLDSRFVTWTMNKLGRIPYPILFLNEVKFAIV